MKRVLFCSPYLSDDNVVKGGINTWGRYIMSYYETYQNNDLHIIPVSFDRQYKQFNTKSLLRRVCSGIRELWKPVTCSLKLICTRKVDVVHLATSAGYGLLRDLIIIKTAKTKGIKTVVHFHFGRIPELAVCNNWEWKLIRQLIRVCSVAVVMNKPSEKVLNEYNFTNVVYLPNPISQDVLVKIDSMSGEIKRVPRRLLFAGHIIRTKGVYELVRACARIPNIELYLVGKCLDNIRKELETIAFTASSSDNWLKILGEQTQDNVLKEMLRADMFVFPSYTEGFPNVILEAMACGCPIVASNVGAIPEMLDISGMPCGVCFNPMDEEGVYNAIVDLINNDPIKQRYASSALKRVNELYTIRTIWGQIIDIWKK